MVKKRINYTSSFNTNISSVTFNQDAWKPVDFNCVTDNNTVKSVNIQYNNLGQLIKQTRLGSGNEIIVTKNKYDQAGRLTNIAHVGENKTIYADYDLKWDNGNRITDFDFTYLNGPAKRNTSNYRYDKTSQLINADYNFIKNETYDFDRNGNRRTAEIQGQKQNYKTGEYNRLLSDEHYNYTYDHEGNRTSKTSKIDGTTTKYLWDHRNRLIMVAMPTETIGYIYDYQNRLVKRTDQATNQYFVHDNWQIILRFDNKNNNNTNNQAITPTHRYLWSTKQDELISNNNWTLGDHLNTIRDVVKSDGNVVAHLDYNSFGKQISVTKNNDNLSFAYTGKLFDQTSDLQWNINRWYDSNVGRWMSEDVDGFRNKDVNLFRYVHNSTLIFNDYQGNTSILAILSKGVIIAGHVGTAVTFADVFADFASPNTSFTIQANGNSSTIVYIVTDEFDANIKKRYPSSSDTWRKFCPTEISVKSSIIVFESDVLNTSGPTSTALEINKTVSFNRDIAGDSFSAKFGARLSLSCRNTTTQTCVTVTTEDATEWTEVCDYGGDVELYFSFRISYLALRHRHWRISPSYRIGGPENRPIGTFTCI
jgi:RHS repeat-associated protein